MDNQVIDLLEFIRRQPLVLEFLVILSDQVSSNSRLEVRDDLGQAFVPEVLQHSEDSSLEEDLGVTQSVVILIQLKSGQHLLTHHFTIDETRWNDIGGQNGVPGNSKDTGLYIEDRPASKTVRNSDTNSANTVIAFLSLAAPKDAV